MAPIRSYTNWNVRSTDNDAQIEPYRHYYFICEGRNTEKWYFEKLIDIRKELSIHSDIELVYLEKTDEDENLSNPTQLIDFADQQKRNGSIAFDHKFDKMIVVFDADVFESIYTDYNEVIAKGLQKNLLGVTNPSFELFLLLHYPNSVDELIHDALAGFIGEHLEGSMGLLEVLPEYRSKGYGYKLETFLINHFLRLNVIPFCQVRINNSESLALQKKIGMEISELTTFWISD